MGGREWLYWVGGGRPSSRRARANMKEPQGPSSAGCMCAVFQLFDLHPFQISLNHHNPDSPFLQEEAISPKGVEAPRNSLELEEQAAMKEQASSNFPAGIQIKTRRTEDLASECSSSSSPATKTPNLVARLMGLDLLPEHNSPSFSSANPPKKSQRKDRNILNLKQKRTFFDDDIGVGPRSLPETPRMSSARRSDVEFHRLSLQINKENVNEDELALSSAKRKRGRTLMKQDDNYNNRSPGHYAKQIVKQVKERVSKRVGLIDITNTKEEIIRRDQNLVLLKTNNNRVSDTQISPHDGKQLSSSTPSCSPKLRFLDTNRNKSPAPANSGTNKSPRISTSSDNSSSLKPKNQVIVQEHHQQQQQQRQKDIKKVIKNKKEEPFVRSPAKIKANLKDKAKKAPLSTDQILNISGPTLMPVKKDPSPPATKVPQKQSQVSDALSSKRNTQLSSNTSHSYKHLQPHQIFTVPEYVPPDNTNGCATTPSAVSAATEYKHYIQRILKRTGIIDSATPLTLGKWHTPSHPLDPSIFYYLELFQPSSAAFSASVLSRRSNRKLIFQLVDELLGQILRPHFDFNIWTSPINSNADHFSLIDELCKKIDSFPMVNCQVLEDIDSLIDKDLSKSRLNRYFEAEGESIACEIEDEIVEWLVRETVSITVGGFRTKGERGQGLVDGTWGAFT